MSSLSGIALAKRRQVAATLGLFSMLFVAVGAVAATGPSTGVIKGFVVIALVVAALLGLMAWGVLHSVRIDAAEQKLEAAIDATVRAGGRRMCDCGVEHDPTEMHVVGDEHEYRVDEEAACSHDGRGTDCAHSCDTCVLATMRPSPHRTRAERLARS